MTVSSYLLQHIAHLSACLSFSLSLPISLSLILSLSKVTYYTKLSITVRNIRRVSLMHIAYTALLPLACLSSVNATLLIIVCSRVLFKLIHSFINVMVVVMVMVMVVVVALYSCLAPIIVA